MFTLSAVLAIAASTFDPNNVAVIQEPVESLEIRLPMSDSVRAATWDQIEEKPSASTKIRVACIVMEYSGGPGGCVSASLIPSDSTQIDWAGIVDRYRKDVAANRATDTELINTVQKRIRSLRLYRGPPNRQTFSIRIFEEDISPSDARPFLTTESPLRLADVSMTEPVDVHLFSILFPPTAIRNNVSARVTITCRVQDNLSLLCRDLGTIRTNPADADYLDEEFRFATYQLASSLRFEPETKSGDTIVGKDLSITINWAQ